jgi:colanic acid/amylovoran biosynthesis protein
VHLVSGLYSPAETKGILSKLDLLISGRVHAAVGALAQHVPTLIIDYGHEPKAHKLKGFADVAGVLDCVCDPADQSNLLAKFTELWTNREGVRHELEGRIPEVQEMSRENFNQLVLLLES